jgi:hypothetical protein
MYKYIGNMDVCVIGIIPLVVYPEKAGTLTLSQHPFRNFRRS